MSLSGTIKGTDECVFAYVLEVPTEVSYIAVSLRLPKRTLVYACLSRAHTMQPGPMQKELHIAKEVQKKHASKSISNDS